MAARIKTVSAKEARGLRRVMVRWATRRYGYLPGIFQVLLPDLKVARQAGGIYGHLHLRGGSPLTRLEREMVAVVVNGAVSGAP